LWASRIGNARTANQNAEASFDSDDVMTKSHCAEPHAAHAAREAGGSAISAAAMPRRRLLQACACCAGIAVAGPGFAAGAPPLKIEPLARDIWLHTTWKLLANGAPFPSNGLIVRGEQRALVIDTTWPTADMAPMLDKARALAGAMPLSLAVTHAHDDRMSGLDIARAAGIRSFAYHLTQQDAPKRGLPLADEVWQGPRKRIELGGRGVEFFYPGPAHTRDNVVAFIADAGVLFGGCMLRAKSHTVLGNLADAVVADWPASMDRVIAEFGARTKIVVPGHGPPGGPDLLAHTRALASAGR
jgi:glyoxylase-like metal-dependent hydrolase (beta-lactamase superfamily II)